MIIIAHIVNVFTEGELYKWFVVLAKCPDLIKKLKDKRTQYIVSLGYEDHWSDDWDSEEEFWMDDAEGDEKKLVLRKKRRRHVAKNRDDNPSGLLTDVRDSEDLYQN